MPFSLPLYPASISHPVLQVGRKVSFSYSYGGKVIVSCIIISRQLLSFLCSTCSPHCRPMSCPVHMTLCVAEKRDGVVTYNIQSSSCMMFTNVPEDNIWQYPQPTTFITTRYAFK